MHQNGLTREVQWPLKRKNHTTTFKTKQYPKRGKYEYMYIIHVYTCIMYPSISKYVHCTAYIVQSVKHWTYSFSTIYSGYVLLPNQYSYYALFKEVLFNASYILRCIDVGKPK